MIHANEKNLAFLALLALALLGYFFQPLGFLPVLVFGFFLPGFVLVKLLRFELGFAELFALSVLGSVLFSSHLVYWASMLLGYSRETVLGCFALIAIVFYLASSEKLSPPSFKRSLSENKSAIFFSLIIFAAFFILFSKSFWVETDNGFVTGGWNYGDSFHHLAIIQSVNNGNFPPQQPTFSGYPLAYHWFVDFHTAFVSLYSGVFPTFVIRFENSLLIGLLAFFAFLLFGKIARDKKTALLAAFLLIFGGGFGYADFIKDANEGKGSLLELAEKNVYDNHGDLFKIPSLLGGFLITQRPQVAGLAVLVAVIYMLVSAFPKDGRKTVLAGLLAGAAAPFHYYAFGAVVVVSGLYFVFESFKEKKLFWKPAALFLVPCLAVALPFAFFALNYASSAGIIKIHLGWEAPMNDAFSFAFFYVANFGVPFLLALSALFLVKNDKKWFLFAWLLLMFLIPNVFSLSQTLWDMNKFFNYMLIPVSLLAALVLARLPRNAAALLVLFSVLTPFLIFYWHYQSPWIGLTPAESRAGNWIDANLPRKSVFLASDAHNHPVDAIAGRFRITGYIALVGNYGLPYQERENDLDKAFCGSPDDALEVARKYGAEYVYVGNSERNRFKCAYAFESDPHFERIYEDDGIRIYEIRGG